MDSQKYFIYIFTLILSIFTNILDTQRITCPSACDVGYTCAMVRHGSGPSTPGCITMQEAILLHQALNGGPSGPSSGINIQNGAGFPQPHIGTGFPQSPRPGDPIPPFPQAQRPGDPIPGMNFLGGTGPQQQSFEQRFAQGIGSRPQNFVNPPNMLGQQNNFGMSGVTGPINGPGFLDPTAGQFGPTFGQFGPTAGQFGPIGTGAGSPPIGFRPQIDGGHSQISSASSNREHTNIAQHDPSPGGGSLPRNNGFPGEQLSPDFNVDPRLGSSHSDLNDNTLNLIPDGFINTGFPQTNVDNKPGMITPEQGVVEQSGSPQEAPVLLLTAPQKNENNASMAINFDGINMAPVRAKSNEQSQVSSIRQDSSGLHYIFFPRPPSAGFRVNITKDGFCPRDNMTRGITCRHACFSDEQCQLGEKCCPSGCSLRCRSPIAPVEENIPQRQGNAPPDNVPAIEARCIPCQSHLDCNSHDQFCTTSAFCGQTMVCRQMVRR